MNDAVIEVRGLCKSFNRGWSQQHSVDAVSGIDLSIGRNQVWALAGPNGAGKTTLLHCILGLLHPSQGDVRVLGAAPRASRSRMGFQPEIFYCYGHLNCRQNLAYFGKLGGLKGAALDQAVAAALQNTGLEEVAERKTAGFSKGMLQRLGLAQSILHDPEILIWDEPTTGLDPEGRKLVFDLLLRMKAAGKTVLLSTHILADVERVCDHIAVVARGTLRASSSIQSWLEERPGQTLEQGYLALVGVSRG